MKSLTLLLLSVVLLCGFATRPSSAADQADAQAAAIPLAPSQQPVPGPLLIPTVEPLAAPVSPSAPVFRMGIVDVERISRESALGKAAQATVKGQQEKMQKRLDEKRGKLDKMRADIERKIPTLQPAQRDAKVKEFQKKVEEMQKFGRNAEQELMATQERLTKELFAAVEQAAGEIGTAKKLSVVIVKREVLYVDRGIEVQDISDEIVTRMNDASPRK